MRNQGNLSSQTLSSVAAYLTWYESSVQNDNSGCQPDYSVESTVVSGTTEYLYLDYVDMERSGAKVREVDASSLEVSFVEDAVTQQVDTVVDTATTQLQNISTTFGNDTTADVEAADAARREVATSVSTASAASVR